MSATWLVSYFVGERAKEEHTTVLSRAKRKVEERIDITTRTH